MPPLRTCRSAGSSGESRYVQRDGPVGQPRLLFHRVRHVPGAALEHAERGVDDLAALVGGEEQHCGGDFLGAPYVWGMKFVEPLQLLRGSFARLRLY